MIRRMLVTEPYEERKCCLVGLPGRGMPGDLMDRFCEHTGLMDTMRVCLEPPHYAWYPSPHGIKDQDEAIDGMKIAVAELEDKLNMIQKMWKLSKAEIALVGYSAGSVMALQLLANSAGSFAGVVSMAGAILEPHKLKKARNDTPVLLRHNRNDDCFDWYERYLPMKNAMYDKGYNTFVNEGEYGGHGITRYDAHVIGHFLAPLLGYDDSFGIEEDEDDKETEE